MSLTLGRDCTITLDGVSVPACRDTVIDLTAATIPVRPFGSRVHGVYQTGYSYSVSIETIDDTAVTTAVTKLQSGAEVAVVVTGWSFTGVVTAVSDAQPLEGVRAFRIVIDSTIAGLRT